MTKIEKAENELDAIVAANNLPYDQKEAFRKLANGHICDWVGYGYPETAANEWGRLATQYPKINTSARETVARVMKSHNVAQNNV